MIILLYLYYPFFDDHLAGGVQVWLRFLVDHLSQDPKYKINIVCPDSKRHSFALNANHSLIDMEQNNLPPKSVYDSLKILEDEESKADIIWSIDRKFPVKTSKPLLLSLNTICYERELMSFFQSDFDISVFPSNFSRNVFSFLPDEEKKKMITIPYYVETTFTEKYSNKQIEEVYNKYIEYDSSSKYILFPHRPDYSKGHFEAIDIIEELVKMDSSYRLLIPLPPDSKVADITIESKIIENVKEYVAKKNLERYVIFHNWVSYSDLPLFYKGGYCTLFLSRLPETFGLSLLNSVVSSTPAISYGSGALKEVVEDSYMHRIAENPMDVVDIIINNKIKYDEDIVNSTIENYSISNVVSQYKQIFDYLNGTKR